MKLAVLVAVLGLVASGQALKCYSCNSKSTISGVSLAGAVLNVLKNFPACTEFDPNDPEQKFVQECPILNNKGCMKVVDPNDSTNVMRSCFLTAKNECKDGTCFCASDLCNGATGGWPSAAVLLATLAAALVGGR